MSKTLVALYQDIADAQEVLRDLQNHGFDLASMSLVTKGTLNLSDQHREISAAEGRDFGAIIGGFTGLVIGLVVITIPGIGPILAAGPLAAVFGGAAGTVIGASVGAVTGGLSAGLVKMNVLPDKAHLFAESVLRGNVLVTVGMNDATMDRAIDIVSRYLPIDIGFSDEKPLTGLIESDPDVTPEVTPDFEETRSHARDYEPKNARLR